MTVELDESELAHSDREELQRYQAFWYTLLMRAIQEAAGSVIDKKDDADKDALSRAQMASDAKKWLLSDDDHAPEVGVRGMIRNEEGKLQRATWLCRGASCRWVLEILDIDPDLAQSAFRRMTWRQIADKVRTRADLLGVPS